MDVDPVFRRRESETEAAIESKNGAYQGSPDEFDPETDLRIVPFEEVSGLTMDASYLITFVSSEVPDVRALHETCREQGLTTSPEGDTDTYAEYRVGLDLHRDGAVDAVVQSVEQVDTGTLYVWTESGTKIGLTTEARESMGEWWKHLRVTFRTTAIDRDHQTERVVRERIDEVVDLVTALVPVVDPEFVWSDSRDDDTRHDSVKPHGRPIADNVRDLSWITVMSDSVLEQFGGREHVLETPAWRVEELATGHVLLVLRDHPYDPTETPDGSWKRHLL